ncbi:MAG: 4Fe-4S binding protein [Nitrososphaeria archaeon]
MQKNDKKIGVYVCRCGGNIADVVDTKKVAEEASKMKGVAVARDYMFMCSEAGQKMIEDDVKNLKLDAVVVAACSPKLHESTFRNVMKRAGGNPYMYYHANIREQVSWVHEHEKEKATEKAIREVRAAVAYVAASEPLEKITVTAEKSVLIIGGGIAGMRAAIDIADMGMNAFLVEKEPFLGGMTAKFNQEIFPYGKDSLALVKDLIDELKKRQNIAVFTNAELEELSGYIGNFMAKIKIKPRFFREKCKDFNPELLCPKKVIDHETQEERSAIMMPPFEGAYPEVPAIDTNICDFCGQCAKACSAIDLSQKEEILEIKIGAVIVATGFETYTPKQGEFGYGTEGVITLPTLIKILNKRGYLTFDGRKAKSIAMIYCVGSRQQEGNQYCSRYCCNAALEAAISVQKSGTKVFHLFRDIRAYGKNELLYERASTGGSVFLKYSQDSPPAVIKKDGKLTVKVKDLLTEGKEVDLDVDAVVLVTGMVPRENEKLNSFIKVSVGKDGFYQEVHPKLKPVETMISGIFICGTAQGPKMAVESICSASAAAAKAASLILKGYIELEPFVATVDPALCSLSGDCIKECPYNAIYVYEYEGSVKKARVNEAVCKGCGACVAVCPNGAIQLKGLRNSQIESMIVNAGGFYG